MPPLKIDQNGPLTGYVIQYTRVGSNDNKEIITSGTTHKLQGLVAFVDYLVRVAAMNVNGTGPFSGSMVQVSGQHSK